MLVAFRFTVGTQSEYVFSSISTSTLLNALFSLSRVGFICIIHEAAEKNDNERERETNISG